MDKPAGIANPYEKKGRSGDKKTAKAEPKASRLRLAGRALPLRTKLIILVIAIVGAGLGVNAVAVAGIMREVSYQRVDVELQDAMESWAVSSELFSNDRSRRGPPSDYYVAKVFPDGSSIIFNDAQSAPELTSTEIGTGPHTVPAAEGSASSTHWRVMAERSGEVITVVGKSMARESVLLYRLTATQLLIGLLVLVGILVPTAYLVRRSLRSMRTVEETAAAIAGGELDRRVPQWPMTTEVGQVANALNIMLEQLQASILNAQQKEEQMRRFVGDASHELRTPLTSVKGYAELYHSGATRDADWVLEKISGEAQRMSLLVEDLLSLTRAEGSRMETTCVDVLELGLAVTGSLRAAYPDRSIELVNNASSVPLVDADPARLHQILTNLISNALTHGGPEAQVRVELGEHVDQIDGISFVEMRVVDNGIGMSPEDAEHVFERFYRADTSRSRASGGSGLGLAITKSLVEAHHGVISVKSAEGEGTSFTVLLPAHVDQ